MSRYNHTEFHIPAPSKIFTPAVTTFLILMILGFALVQFAGGFVKHWLMLNPFLLVRGRVWQLLTYPFVGSCAWSVILNGLAILFLGSAVEREWRTRSFVGLLLVVTVVCGLLWSLVCALLGQPYLLAGAETCVFGLIAAFGLFYRGQRFMLFMATVEGQVLAWIFIGIGIVFCLAMPIMLITVLGALVAYLYIKYLWKLKNSEAGHVSRSGTHKPGRFVDID